MRQNVLPILEAHGVDLFLTGHNHSYERSYLLDGHHGPSSSFDASHQIDAGDGDPGGDGEYVKDSGQIEANGGRSMRSSAAPARSQAARSTIRRWSAR